jgi:hypothetical protein
VAEWSCSGLQSRLRRFDSDPSLDSPVPRRPKKLNGVEKSPENPAERARHAETFEAIAREWLEDALAPVKSRNFASVTEPARVGELLRAIDGMAQPAA